MLSLFEHKKKSLESGVTAAVKGELPLAKEQEDALFKPSKYDPNAAEKNGYPDFCHFVFPSKMHYYVIITHYTHFFNTVLINNVSSITAFWQLLPESL